MEWLVTVTENSDNDVSAIGRQTKPKIQRVPDLLQQNHKDARLFKPDVVAIGPFHHDDDRLKPMEKYKMAAAKRLAAGHSIDLFYNKVRDVAGQARECYADIPPLGEEEFTNMMFFDGCFLLSIVELYTCKGSWVPQIPIHLLGFIMKDMFLLENQIPLLVLKALVSLKPEINLTEFVDSFIGISTSSPASAASLFAPPSFALKFWKSPMKKSNPSKDGGEACHLLDLLRTQFLGPADNVLFPVGVDYWTAFRPGMELKEVGIKFGKSRSRKLRDVLFKPGFLYSSLALPQLVVDDQTRSRFLNLIALEMCPESVSDYGISSYIWLMDKIIDDPKDIRELRSKGVLLNELGSDQQAANLFNELAPDLSPDPRAYVKVMQGINKHYKNKCRVSVVKMLVNLKNIHFRTPWTAIAVFAAVFLIILTVIQTVFTVWPRGH